MRKATKFESKQQSQVQSRASLFIATVLAAFSILLSSPASGQQMITTTTPLQQFGDSYYNFGGFNWGLSGPGWFANFPGGGNVPPFGGADPNAGISGGVTGRIGNARGNLGFNFAQGSRRFGSVTAPSLTTTDGVPGSMFSGTVRPFVTGFTPVVGGFAGPVAPQVIGVPQVVDRFGGTPNNTIERAGLARQQATLQDIARRQAQYRNDKAYEYWVRGTRAEQEGNLKQARANYRMALGKASEPLRTEVLRRMYANGWKP